MVVPRTNRKIEFDTRDIYFIDREVDHELKYMHLEY